MNTWFYVIIFFVFLFTFLSGFAFGYKEYLKDTSEKREYPTVKPVARKYRFKRIYPPRRRRIFQ